MFGFKQFVSKITDKGNPSTVSEGSASASIDSEYQEDQLSTEGFICPSCMTALPSKEALEEHYNKIHMDGLEATASGGVEDATNSAETIEALKQEIGNLQLTLMEEQAASEELKQEFLKVQDHIFGAEKQEANNQANLSSERAQLNSEIMLLRQQLADSLKKVSDLESNTKSLENKLRESTEIAEKGETEVAKNNCVSELEETNATLQKALEEAVNEKNELNSELTGLRKVLEHKKKAVEQMQKELTEQMQDSEETIQEAKEELLALKSIHLSEKTALHEEIQSLKTALNNAKTKEGSFEDERTRLKDEITRLREQHSHLCQKIEGGEGAKAALVDLQKENERMKQNLDDSYAKNCELETNLENVKTEYDKVLMERKRSSEEFTKDKHTLESEITQLKGQLTEKDKEIANLKNDIKNAQNKVLDLEKSVDQLQRCIDNKETEIKDVQKQFTTSKKNEEELVKKLDSTSAQLSQSKSQLQSKITELEKQSSKIQELSTMLEKKSKQIDSISAELNESHVSRDAIKNRLQSLQSEKEESEQRLNAENKELKANVQNAAELLKTKVKELTQLEENTKVEMDNMKKELEHLVTQMKDSEFQVAELKQSLADAHALHEAAKGKMQILQTQSDKMVTTTVELEKKIKSLEEEKALLLERCLSGEGNVEQLNDTISELKRKLQESLSALQELGRENQSLQMECAKQQNRKWKDDSNVTACSHCSKEFTLTIRKHHCRMCGEIFCNDCSSKNATIPSSKKPVRVCDACYKENSVK